MVVMTFYPVDVEFSDRKDCSNCHRLLGMKITKVWPKGPLNDGIRMQWECDGCHCRTWDVLPYANTSPRATVDQPEKWKVCDLCRQKFLWLEEYCGAHICVSCKCRMEEVRHDED